MQENERLFLLASGLQLMQSGQPLATDSTGG